MSSQGKEERVRTVTEPDSPEDRAAEGFQFFPKDRFYRLGKEVFFSPEGAQHNAPHTPKLPRLFQLGQHPVDGVRGLVGILKAEEGIPGLDLPRGSEGCDQESEAPAGDSSFRAARLQDLSRGEFLPSKKVRVGQGALQPVDIPGKDEMGRDHRSIKGGETESLPQVIQYNGEIARSDDDLRTNPGLEKREEPLTSEPSPRKQEGLSLGAGEMPIQFSGPAAVVSRQIPLSLEDIPVKGDPKSGFFNPSDATQKTPAVEGPGRGGDGDEVILLERF